MLLIDYLAHYAAYHRDRRNIVTHFAGIPLIVLALLILLSRPLMPLTNEWIVSPAVAVALGVLGGFYWPLDRRYTLVLAGYFGVCIALGNWFATQETALWLGAGLSLFVLGWIIQFVGHAFEGRKPAFFDELISLLVGPLFVVAELGFLCGWRRDIEAQIAARAASVGPGART